LVRPRRRAARDAVEAPRRESRRLAPSHARPPQPAPVPARTDDPAALGLHPAQRGGVLLVQVVARLGAPPAGVSVAVGARRVGHGARRLARAARPEPGADRGDEIGLLRIAAAAGIRSDGLTAVRAWRKLPRPPSSAPAPGT